MVEFTKKELQQIKNLKKSIVETDEKILKLRSKKEEMKSRLKMIEEKKLLKFIEENNIEFEDLKSIVSSKNKQEKESEILEKNEIKKEESKDENELKNQEQKTSFLSEELI